MAVRIERVRDEHAERIVGNPAATPEARQRAREAVEREVARERAEHR